MPKLWTPEEEDLLRELSLTRTKSEVARELGRSASSVSNKAWKMKVTFQAVTRTYGIKWVPEDVQRLHKLLDHHTVQEIADITGWGRQRVYNRIRQEGLSPQWRIIHGRKVRYRAWTHKEEVFLRWSIETRTVIWIAKKLDRTEASVNIKLHLMGHKALQGVMTLKKLAGILGISVSALQRRREKLKLKFRRTNLRGSFNPRGAEAHEVVQICDDILNDPGGRINVSARKIREIRDSYESIGTYETW